MTPDYDAPDDYPLDDESMLFLINEGGWQYVGGLTPALISPGGTELRVPADEHGRTLLNAFKIYLWQTTHALHPHVKL